VAVKRLIPLALGAVLLGLLLALALGWEQNAPKARPAEPLEAKALLSHRAVGFGDRLGAQVDLLVDPSRLKVGSIRLEPRFDPYRIVGTARTERRAGGLLISYRYILECLDPRCLPQAETERRFNPVVVTYTTQEGDPEFRTVEWPRYHLVSRVTEADRANPAQRFRWDRALPSPSYAISPGTAQALLAALCGVFALGAGVLLWFAIGPRRMAGRQLSPLARALASVRASSSNGRVAERRKALAWLGRELGAVEEDDLARGAARLAWSRPNPTPESAAAFADDVEERT
jgi:hypothetical protein